MPDKQTQTDTPTCCLLIHPFDIDIKKRLWLLPTSTFQEFQDYVIQKLQLQNENSNRLIITYRGSLIKRNKDLQSITNKGIQNFGNEIRIFAHLNKPDYKIQLSNLEKTKKEAKQNDNILKTNISREKIQAIRILMKHESKSIKINHRHRQRMQIFYAKIAPQKMKVVDATLAKFVGKEMRMWQHLDKKYKDQIAKAGYQDAFSVGKQIKIKFLTDADLGFGYKGCCVVKINPESQADQANIKRKWHIISINGQKISTDNHKKIKLLLIKAKKENPSMTITFGETESQIPNHDSKNIVSKLDNLNEQAKLVDGKFDTTKVLVNIKPAPISLINRAASMPANMSKIISDKNKRTKIREEMRSTEVRYVESLNILKDTYVIPLKKKKKEDPHFIDPRTYTNLVSNLEMLADFHETFLKDLQKNSNISNVILKYVDYFKMYTIYTNGYDKCLKSLSEFRSNKDFSLFMEDVRKNLQERGNLDLMSYLIMPVQRIPRYVLLLRELKKNTPTEHQHYEELQEAIEKVQRIASHINESRREMENMSALLRLRETIHGLPEHLVLFEPHRHLIKEAKMREIKIGGVFSTVKESDRIFYLFNDLLVWTTDAMKYKGHSSLAALEICWGNDKKCTGGNAQDALKDWLHLNDSKTQIFFKSVNGKEETNKWKNDLDQARTTQKKLRQRLRVERSRQRASMKIKQIKPGSSQTINISKLKLMKKEKSTSKSASRSSTLKISYSNEDYSQSSIEQRPSQNGYHIRHVRRRHLREYPSSIQSLANDSEIAEDADGNNTIHHIAKPKPVLLKVHTSPMMLRPHSRSAPSSPRLSK